MKKLFLLITFVSINCLGVQAEDVYQAPKFEFKSDHKQNSLVKKSHWDNDYKVEDIQDSDREVASDEDDDNEFDEEEVNGKYNKRGPSSSKKKNKDRAPNSSNGKDSKKFRPAKWEFKHKH